MLVRIFLWVWSVVSPLIFNPDVPMPDPVLPDGPNSLPAPGPAPSPPAPDVPAGSFDFVRSLQIVAKSLKDMAIYLTATKVDDQLLGYVELALNVGVVQDFLRRLVANEFVQSSRDEARTKAIVGLASAAPPAVRTAVNLAGLDWDKFIGYTVWLVRVLLLMAGKR